MKADEPDRSRPRRRQGDSSLTADEWQRIDSIFHEVVELDESERAERLHELTGDDQQLRAEVESLLAFDDDGQHQLPAIRRSNDVPVPTRQSGACAGRYRLLFPVAINRTSEVWCAEATETASDLSQDEPSRVAIKFLRDEANTVRRLERFRNEAMLLSRFRHPNIAEFLDCGADDQDVPYIVMRYVAGTPITEFADHKNLTVDERLRLMIRVCDAVSYAHRFLIVHRDLKPSNILVTSQREPVILDFGISKSLDNRDHRDSADARDLALTTTNERPMTPAYAAPEQVHGEPITTATDVYALGLILYELLSGHHAYADAAHTSEEKLFDRVCRSVPRRPSDVIGFTAQGVHGEKEVPQEPRLIAALRGLSPNQLRKRLRQSLDAVVLRAMAKQPGERYESIGELRNDLHNVLDHRPIATRVRDDRLRNAVRRNPLKYLLGAALASALVVGSVASLTGYYFKSTSDSQLRSSYADLETVKRDADNAETEQQRLTREMLETERLMRVSANEDVVPNPVPAMTRLCRCPVRP